MEPLQADKSRLVSEISVWSAVQYWFGKRGFLNGLGHLFPTVSDL